MGRLRKLKKGIRARLRGAVKPVVEITTGVAVASVGIAVGDTPGALTAAALAPFLAPYVSAATQYFERQLSQTQRRRVESFQALVAAHIAEKIAAGLRPREDGFFLC